MIETTLAAEVVIFAVAERDMSNLTVLVLASATPIVEFALCAMCKTTPLTILAFLLLCPVPAQLLDGFGARVQTARHSEAPQMQQSLDHFQFLPIFQPVLCIIVVALQITKTTQNFEGCFDWRRKYSSEPLNPRP